MKYEKLLAPTNMTLDFGNGLIRFYSVNSGTTRGKGYFLAYHGELTTHNNATARDVLLQFI
jgi:hypothetical protein